MIITIIANGTLQMTITEPSGPVQEAALRAVQEAVDLGRVVVQRTAEGLRLEIKEAKAGI